VIVPKSKVPKGRKIIGNCWVYAEKDDGTYKSRNVPKDFSQVPGKDFQEHHSPVVHDTTFRVVVVQKLVYNLHSHQFDIVTAFLYGLLDEEILWTSQKVMKSF
jgi:Reverse transcriptase (RNA-dependent DNA polymerase)